MRDLISFSISKIKTIEQPMPLVDSFKPFCWLVKKSWQARVIAEVTGSECISSRKKGRKPINRFLWQSINELAANMICWSLASVRHLGRTKREKVKT